MKLEVLRMKHELPTTVRIAEIISEAEGIKTILLPCRIEARPGQFVMIWLPGIDAKPVGISYQDESNIGVTVSAVGPWSTQVTSLKEGDLLGVLGPYGNGFSLDGKRIVLVGGGYGTASLMLLAKAAAAKKIETTFIIGAKSKKYLLYREQVQTMPLNTVFTTDDGSFGRAGYNTAVLEEVLSNQKIDSVYACGPELMEKRIAEICRDNKVPCQISLERHMKCGFGVCGACCMDSSGERVCLEGPVFSGEKALQFEEFGKYHRDSSATKQHF
jgi:dihydroorotate dehydrogenase electron transfer subunit